MDVLVPLPVAIPLVTAAALTATGHFLGKRVDDLAGIAAAAATAVISLLLVFHSADHRLVYWFGGWEPRHGLAIGISFTVDPVVQALTLTDVVVSVTVAALLLALAIQVQKRTGTADPDELEPLRG